MTLMTVTIYATPTRLLFRSTTGGAAVELFIPESFPPSDIPLLVDVSPFSCPESRFRELSTLCILVGGRAHPPRDIKDSKSVFPASFDVAPTWDSDTGATA